VYNLTYSKCLLKSSPVSGVLNAHLSWMFLDPLVSLVEKFL